MQNQSYLHRTTFRWYFVYVPHKNLQHVHLFSINGVAANSKHPKGINVLQTHLGFLVGDCPSMCTQFRNCYDYFNILSQRQCCLFSEFQQTSNIGSGENAKKIT